MHITVLATERRPFEYAASIIFADIVPSIEDPEVFVPPEQCIPAPGTFSEVEEMPVYQNLRHLGYL